MLSNDSVFKNPKEITIRAYSPSKINQFLKSDIKANYKTYDDQQQSGGDKEFKIINQSGEIIDISQK